MYLRAARSMAFFVGMCDPGSADDGSQAASQDTTTVNALEILHDCDYDKGRALQQLVKRPVPLNIDHKWNEEETKRFAKGLRQYGKNFFKIRKELLSHKDVTDLVEYYYIFKKTQAANNVRPTRRRGNQKKNQRTPQTPNPEDDIDDVSSSVESEADSDGLVPQCRNCFVTNDKNWYRDDKGLLCKLCNDYSKKFSSDRPTERNKEPPYFDATNHKKIDRSEESEGGDADVDEANNDNDSYCSSTCSTPIPINLASIVPNVSLCTTPPVKPPQLTSSSSASSSGSSSSSSSSSSSGSEGPHTEEEGHLSPPPQLASVLQSKPQILNPTPQRPEPIFLKTEKEDNSDLLKTPHSRPVLAVPPVQQHPPPLISSHIKEELKDPADMTMASLNQHQNPIPVPGPPPPLRRLQVPIKTEIHSDQESVGETEDRDAIAVSIVFKETTNAIFMKYLDRGQNSCSRTDIGFKIKPNSDFAVKKTNPQGRRSSTSSRKSLTPRDENKSMKAEQKSADAQITSHLTGNNHGTSSNAGIVPPFDRNPRFLGSDTPALSQLRAYSDRAHALGLGHSAINTTMAYTLSQSDALIQQRAMFSHQAAAAQAGRDRLEAELLRDKQERDAREREMRERELREFELQEKMKRDLEMKPPGMSITEAHMLQLQREYALRGLPIPPHLASLIGSGLPGQHLPGIYSPAALANDLIHRERELRDRALAERYQAERAMIDPVTRLQMASAVHAHTHAHTHSHYHLHQPDGIPTSGASGLHPHNTGPPPPPHLSPFSAPPSSLTGQLPFGSGINTQDILAREAMLQRELLARGASDPLFAQQLQQQQYQEAFLREQALMRERHGVLQQPSHHRID